MDLYNIIKRERERAAAEETDMSPPPRVSREDRKKFCEVWGGEILVVGGVGKGSRILCLCLFLCLVFCFVIRGARVHQSGLVLVKKIVTSKLKYG